MLVLSRKSGEAVRIITPEGHEILIHVLTTKAGGTKLGFTAPTEYRILREEAHKLLEAVRELDPSGV